MQMYYTNDTDVSYFSRISIDILEAKMMAYTRYIIEYNYWNVLILLFSKYMNMYVGNEMYPFYIVVC